MLTGIEKRKIPLSATTGASRPKGSPSRHRDGYELQMALDEVDAAKGMMNKARDSSFSNTVSA